MKKKLTILPVSTRNTAVRVCGMLRYAKIEYRTRTRDTRFGNTAGLPVPVLNPKRVLSSLQQYVGFGTGIPRVGFSHTVPKPVNTVPVAGTGTYPTVKFAVSYGTRGFLVLLLLY